MSPAGSSRHGLRRRDAAFTRAESFGPNMTPMVDVVMVILVFFMVSAAFVGPEWFLRTVLPAPAGAGRAGTPDPTVRPVRIDVTLSVVGGSTVATGQGLTDASLERMAEALAEAARLAGDQVKQAVEVVLRPQGAVPYRDIIRLHEAAQRAGIERITVAVRPRSDPAEPPGN
ncbi:MAG: biopolymer transporter ExbD [Phycisphaeraceae bacterium]|nr:biopolymer transporter ExbD [Phycisphaeraceae bacterium]